MKTIVIGITINFTNYYTIREVYANVRGEFDYSIGKSLPMPLEAHSCDKMGPFGGIGRTFAMRFKALQLPNLFVFG